MRHYFPTKNRLFVAVLDERDRPATLEHRLSTSGRDNGASTSSAIAILTTSALRRRHV